MLAQLGGALTRVRERTKGPRGKDFEQIVEFTEFDRPARVHAHIVEGPYPIDGTWSFVAEAQERELTLSPRVSCPACCGCC